jgi:hypothetical protein
MFRFQTRQRYAQTLAVVIFLGFTGSVTAGDPVPWRGVFAGNYTVTPIPNTPTATLVVSANGIGTQIGRFGLSIPHVVNFAASSATGYYQLIASNGDNVIGTFTGQATPIGTDGVYALLVEDVIITGGTGRLADATGRFTSVRLIDRINLQTIDYFNGTISGPRIR